MQVKVINRAVMEPLVCVSLGGRSTPIRDRDGPQTH